MAVGGCESVLPWGWWVAAVRPAEPPLTPASCRRRRRRRRPGFGRNATQSLPLHSHRQH